MHKWLVILLGLCALLTMMSPALADNLTGNVSMIWDDIVVTTGESEYYAVVINEDGTVFAGGYVEDAITGLNIYYRRIPLDGIMDLEHTITNTGNHGDWLNDLVLGSDGYLFGVGVIQDDAETAGDFAVFHALGDSGTNNWNVLLGGDVDSGDVGRKIVVDDQNNVCATGSVVYSATLSDIFTACFDSAGNKLWSHPYDGPDHSLDYGADLAFGPNGQVHVAANIRSDGQRDVVLIQYDQTGNMIWDVIYDDNMYQTNDYWAAIAVDDSGNIFVTGYSYPQTDDDKNSAQDIVTAKYDSDGNQKWMTWYDEGDADMPKAIALDSKGNVYVVGTAQNPASDNDFITICYEDNGDSAAEKWVNRPSINPSSFEKATDVVIDAYDNIYVTGYVYQSENGDKASGSADMMTLMYNDAGDLIWSAQYGQLDPVYEEPMAIATDNKGRVAIAGYASGTPYNMLAVLYQGGCEISGEFYANNAPNPGNTCQHCDMAITGDDWSSITDGSTCDDGLFCTATDTCKDGVCTGEGDPCASDEVCNDLTDSCDPESDDDDDSSGDDDDDKGGDGDDDDEDDDCCNCR